jgi:hypothetical protein
MYYHTVSRYRYCTFMNPEKIIDNLENGLLQLGQSEGFGLLGHYFNGNRIG